MLTWVDDDAKAPAAKILGRAGMRPHVLQETMAVKTD
jgi:hypothetical protein